MNRNASLFNRSADISSWGQDASTKAKDDGATFGQGHQQAREDLAAAVPMTLSRGCTNETPLEFRMWPRRSSCRKRDSDCLFDEDSDEDEIGRFLSSYFDGGEEGESSALDDVECASLVDLTEDATPEGCRSATHQEDKAKTIEPEPVSRAADLQEKIKLHAEKVRRSFCAPDAATKKSATNAKRRKTFHSAFRNNSKGSTNADAATGRGNRRTQSFIDRSQNNNNAFPSSSSSAPRNFSRSSFRSSFVSTESGSSSWGVPDSRCSGASTSAISEEKGSIKELIAPMASLLSDMQQKSDTSLTLNSGPHAISVTKNDVICGSGTLTDTMIGNRRYKVMVELHARAYAKAHGPEERRCVARSVVHSVRGSVPAGRFLRLDVNSGLWREVADDENEGGGRCTTGGGGGGAVDHAEKALRESAKQISPEKIDSLNRSVEIADSHRRSAMSSARFLALAA